MAKSIPIPADTLTDAEVLHKLLFPAIGDEGSRRYRVEVFHSELIDPEPLGELGFEREPHAKGKKGHWKIAGIEGEYETRGEAAIALAKAVKPDLWHLAR